jgi:hypothetical protein
MKKEMQVLVEKLKEANQDYEFYPTSDEMLACIAPSLSGVLRGNYCNDKSVLDIGAGKCNFKKFFKKLGGYRFNYYAIEKSQILINDYDPDTVVLGTDFNENTLVDKKVDVIFCNPPYSDYVNWTTRILKEGNAKTIYMVIPSRWKDNEQLNNVLETLKINYSILGSFDFLNAERSARAIVDVIEFTKSNSEHYECDPFSIWFNETFTTPEEENELFKKYDKEEFDTDKYFGVLNNSQLLLGFDKE